VDEKVAVNVSQGKWSCGTPVSAHRLIFGLVRKVSAAIRRAVDWTG